MRELFKGSFFSLLFKGLGALSFFFLHAYIARTYGLEEFGAFNMVLVLLVIGSTFGKLGIDMYLVRKLPEYASEPEKAGAFILKAVRIVVVASIAMSVLMGLCLHFLGELLFDSYNKPLVLALLPFSLLVYSLYEITFSIFWGYHKINSYNFFKLFSSQFFTFCLIIGAGYAGLKTEPILIYYAVLLVCLIVALVYGFGLVKKEKIKWFAIQYEMPIIKKAFPMMISTMMLIFTLSIDRMMLSYYWDLKTVGIFSAISKITFVMTFFPSIISSYIMPKVALAFTEKDTSAIKGLYKKSLKAILLSTLPFLLVFAFFPQPFLQLFNKEITGPEHITAFYIFLGAYFVSGSLIGPLDVFLNMTDNQKVGQVTIMLSTLLNLILNWLLIPDMGISGAGIATLISFSAWQSSNYVILKRKGII